MIALPLITVSVVLAVAILAAAAPQAILIVDRVMLAVATQVVVLRLIDNSV
jgi:hypothetical protein